MKQKFFYVMLAVVLITTFVGCSGINSLLKGGDPDQIYAKALEFYKLEKWSRASTLFEGVQHQYVGHSREDTITFYNARCKFEDHDYDTASQLLDEFRRKFGRSAFIENAEIAYTLCFYYMSPEPKRDQTMTMKTLQTISEFKARYPESNQISKFDTMETELIGRLHDKAYINAYTYFKIGKYKASIVAMKNALKEYPESKYREELMYLIVVSSHKLSKDSIFSKQKDRYLSMLDSYYTFMLEYPESDYGKKLESLEKDAKDYLDKSSETL